MNVVRFGLLGLGTGGVYAVLALGLVLVYRASGVLNFAAGSMGCIAAFLFYHLHLDLHWPTLLALVVSVAVGGGIGVVTQVAVMSRLRQASALTKLIATLGVLALLQGVALIEWGSGINMVGSVLPTTTLKLTPRLYITEDRLILLVAAMVIAGILKLVYTHTRFGLATSAVAQNRRAAACSGWSTGTIEMANWAIGGMLSALAAIFVAEIVGLSVGTLTLLVLPAIAAALIGGFNSFLLTVLGAAVLGVVQSEFALYVRTTGMADSVPFLVIIAVIVLGGRARPTRADLPSRLPLPGSGRINVPLLIAGAGVGLALTWTLRASYVDALLTTFIFALVILSVVVVTGYGGQLSLAQWALAGMGAWFAARLVASGHLPFWAAAVIGVVATVPVGLVVALPALRTRGVNLAVTTLGLAEVIVSVILSSSSLTGGLGGTSVGAPRLLGINLDPLRYPARYTTLALIVLVLAGLVVANVRRGRTGRRLLAVRSDERAAAALGIGVYTVKLYAFGLGAALAAMAGILAAFQNPVVVFTQFDIFTSINIVMFAVIAGIGWASGSVLGATLASGSIAAIILNGWLGSSVNKYLAPIAGFFVIFNLIVAPDGLAELNARMYGPRMQPLYRALARISTGRRRAVAPRGDVATNVRKAREVRRPSLTLELRDLSVTYGGVKALQGVSLRVDPGEVLGLIGPNGAGKTTLLDAVTGFTKPAGGDVLLGGQSIRGWSPVRISRAGVGRSFQSVQLFDSMTVRDNLLAAIDTSSWGTYFVDLVHPKRPIASDLMDDLIADFHLEDVLDVLSPELPHGTARLVGVARALLSEPSVLFLDEPAAGLDANESAEVGPMIRRIARERNVSVVLVEHDVPLVFSTCDRVVVLDFGRQIAEGPPDEVRNHPDVIVAYLGDDAEQFAEVVPVHPVPQP